MTIEQLKEEVIMAFDSEWGDIMQYSDDYSIRNKNGMEATLIKQIIDTIIIKAYRAGKEEALKKVYVRDLAQKTMNNVIDELKLLNE